MDTQNQPRQLLDERYIPAQVDGVISLRFLGNTASIAEMVVNSPITPGQLIAAGHWLIYQGEKMWRDAEQAADQPNQDQPKILVPTTAVNINDLKR